MHPVDQLGAIYNPVVPTFTRLLPPKSQHEKRLAASGSRVLFNGTDPKGGHMAMSLTESLKHNRYSVVAVDAAAGRLRVRSEAELCTDFACGEAEVVTDEGRSHALADINPGDIVTLDHKDVHASEIRVVRRVFDEYSSPEW